ncbi:unnamed protein product [Rhizoctonia solani]|uniref:Uncharacterized protein n=1 Tax=Rhizoctonia solani TaxID=456999 RepID=A0A8H2WZM0_9AGAM|nr:unnamed protein product [Rhizoctonia solani]
MDETETSIAAQTQGSHQASREGFFNRDEEQSTRQTLLTSPFFNDGGSNTILSIEDEYLNQIYYEMIDKGLHGKVVVSEGSAAGSISSPDLLNTLDRSSHISHCHHGQPPADRGYWPHKVLWIVCKERLRLLTPAVASSRLTDLAIGNGREKQRRNMGD